MLRRNIRYLDSDKLELRDQRYLRDFEVNFMFDNEVVNVTKEKGQHQVELKDGSAIDYDGVVLATGVTK